MIGAKSGGRATNGMLHNSPAEEDYVRGRSKVTNGMLHNNPAEED